jgi:hypothetical protein
MRQLLGVVCAVILLVAVSSEAQERRGSITGTVKGAAGNPLPGATVEARSPSLVGVATTETDAEGVYRFPALPPGRYEVTARIDFFKPAKAGKIDVKLGQTLTVDLTLEFDSAALPWQRGTRSRSSRARVQRQGSPGRFLGVDFFGGGAVFDIEVAPATETEKGKTVGWGWDAGATVSYGVRWMGITGTFGSQPVAESGSAYHLVVGPRVSSPWAVWGDLGGRFFAHALGGLVRTRGVTPSQSSAEWVLGGGIDILLFRLQFDYVRLNLNGVDRNNVRGFVGGVVPLCFRGCSDDKDLFNVSGRSATK